ncbi:MAG: RNA methyltransferase [Saprospiraceae bacterium]
MSNKFNANETGTGETFQEVVAKRQPDLTVILENVHDHHNIGAVMRTCDSVGIFEIFVLQSEPQLQLINITLGKRTSAGTRRWVDVRYFTDREACFKAVRQKYGRVYATHLDMDAKSLHDLDLANPLALLFGHEHEGVTELNLALCDGIFISPQVGMVQSLNISVAAAVSLYEAYRQRKEAGLYDENSRFSASDREALLDTYFERHDSKPERKYIPKDIRDPKA